MNHRNDLPHYLNRHNFRQGAEIGVQYGFFAEHILKNWQGFLILVDPWQHQPTGYDDAANVDNAKQQTICDEAVKRLETFAPRIQVYRMLSHVAAEKIDDSALDFVYIDCNHSYEAVKLDLKSWYPKVKPTGLLMGHDYRDGIDKFGSVFGVKKAVDEFAKEIGVEVKIAGRGRSASWFFHRP